MSSQENLSQNGNISGNFEGKKEAKKVALLVDYDNFSSGLNQYTRLLFDPRVLKTLARQVGEVELAFVFKDVGDLTVESRQRLRQTNMSLVDCPASRLVDDEGKAYAKDTVDPNVMLMMSKLGRSLNVDVVVLAAVDTDYIDFVQDLRDRGVRTVIAAPSRQVPCSAIARAAGMVLYYDDFLPERRSGNERMREDLVENVLLALRSIKTDELILSFKGLVSQVMSHVREDRELIQQVISSLVSAGVIETEIIRLGERLQGLPEEESSREVTRYVYRRAPEMEPTEERLDGAVVSGQAGRIGLGA